MHNVILQEVNHSFFHRIMFSNMFMYAFCCALFQRSHFAHWIVIMVRAQMMLMIWFDAVMWCDPLLLALSIVAEWMTLRLMCWWWGYWSQFWFWYGCVFTLYACNMFSNKFWLVIVLASYFFLNMIFNIMSMSTCMNEPSTYLSQIGYKPFDIHEWNCWILFVFHLFHQ